MRALKILQLPEDEALALMLKALRLFAEEQRRDVASAAQGLSCSGASKLAKRRRSAVAEAMASGALAARKVGRNWRTTAADVHDWLRRGCPEHAANSRSA